MESDIHKFIIIVDRIIIISLIIWMYEFINLKYFMIFIIFLVIYYYYYFLCYLLIFSITIVA